MVEHMECPRAFFGKLVTEHFLFFPLRTALGVTQSQGDHPITTRYISVGAPWQPKAPRFARETVPLGGGGRRAPPGPASTCVPCSHRDRCRSVLHRATLRRPCGTRERRRGRIAMADVLHLVGSVVLGLAVMVGIQYLLQRRRRGSGAEPSRDAAHASAGRHAEIEAGRVRARPAQDADAAVHTCAPPPGSVVVGGITLVPSEEAPPAKTEEVVKEACAPAPASAQTWQNGLEIAKVISKNMMPAHNLFGNGSYRKALPLYREIADALDVQCPPQTLGLRCEVLRMVGHCHDHLQSHAEAEKSYVKALKLTEGLPTGERLKISMDVLNGLGCNSLHNGDLVKAERYLKRAVALPASEPEIPESMVCSQIAVCNSSLGRVCMMAGRSADALRYFDTGLEIRRNSSGGDLRALAVACLNTANAHAASRDVARAVGLLTEAFQTASQNEYYDVACAAAAALSNCFECVHVYGGQEAPPAEGGGRARRSRGGGADDAWPDTPEHREQAAQYRSAMARLSQEMLGREISETCTICLDAMDLTSSTWGRQPLMVLQCRHVYHVSCFDAWSDEAPTCPECKIRIQPYL